MYIDPLGIPFMQRALGQGELTKRDLQQMMTGQGAAGARMQMSRPGWGQQQPMQFNIPQMGSVGGPDSTRGSGNGPNPYLMSALSGGGGGYASMGADGNWIPGAQGFPGGEASQGGGGFPAMSAMRGMGSK